jgi:hypothetical protein
MGGKLFQRRVQFVPLLAQANFKRSQPQLDATVSGA